MPWTSLLPAAKSQVLAALGPWLEDEVRVWVEANDPVVEFQAYDWSLHYGVN